MILIRTRGRVKSAGVADSTRPREARRCMSASCVSAKRMHSSAVATPSFTIFPSPPPSVFIPITAVPCFLASGISRCAKLR